MTNAQIRNDKYILRVSRLGDDVRITGYVRSDIAEAHIQAFGRPCPYEVVDMPADVVRAMPLDRYCDMEDGEVEALLRNRSSRLTVAIDDVIQF